MSVKKMLVALFVVLVIAIALGFILLYMGIITPILLSKLSILLLLFIAVMVFLMYLKIQKQK